MDEQRVDLCRRDKLEEAVLSCHECRNELFGNPNIKGSTGAITRIETHLAGINGKVQKHESQINKIWLYIAIAFSGGIGSGIGIEKFVS